jgi:hypothetical protein
LSSDRYDGDPQKGGKAFDMERIPYIRPRKPHAIRVPFRSNVCGEHRLFVTIGRGKPFEATASPITVYVNCEAAAPARTFPGPSPKQSAKKRNNKVWRQQTPRGGFGTLTENSVTSEESSKRPTNRTTSVKRQVQ